MTTPSRETVPPALFELESDLMDLVWERGEATTRDALDALNARSGRARAYTTVMTTMARLHSKGLLDRRREQRTDVYTPVMSRDEYMRARAAADIRTLVDQYGEVALVGFAREIDQLDPKRRDQMRRLARRSKG